MATIIQDIIDSRINVLQTQKSNIDAQIGILQQKGQEYGQDPIIDLWNIRDSEDREEKVIITNLSQFPDVYFRYLIKRGVLPADLTNQIVSKLPYEQFIESFPLLQ